MQSAHAPLNFGSLDSVQQTWLRNAGLSNDKSILALDITKETVTFLVDGESVERQLCQVWTRCMGYHRPVAYFNIGKKQEHKDRKQFLECRIPKEHNHG